MALTFTATEATLGAHVWGAEISELTDNEVEAVKKAFLQFGVLIFPNQHPSESSQVNFCKHFGQIEYLQPTRTAEAVPISNVRSDGTLIGTESFSVSLLRVNEGWHTDSSYMPLSAKASCLVAVEVPDSGGGTEWADMRAAYDALDSDKKEQIENLSALHSLFYSQARVGRMAKPGTGYGFHSKGTPLRPLVKVHPETHRKSLYIGGHAYRIPGMSDAEAREFLVELVEYACRPPRIYEHHWKPGDLAIWDNRCMLHRARPYDTKEPRVLRHVRISGEPASEWAATMPDEGVSDATPLRK